MESMTKPVKISFLARAGISLRLPKTPMTKPIKIAFLTKAKVRCREYDSKATI